MKVAKPHSQLALRMVLFVASHANAMAQASPTGTWRSIDDDGKSDRAEIQVTESNGILTRRILRVWKPGVDSGAVCKKCSDDRQNAPLVGLEIIRNVKRVTQDEPIWGQGEILDPASGKTYKVEMTVSKDGTEMKVRGYIGISLIGRTQLWRRSR